MRIDRLTSCKASDTPTLAGMASFIVYRCQLGFPIIDTSSSATQLVSPGVQNDGVHQIVSSKKVGVIVNGFDKNVGYGYAAGTDLTQIVVR